MSVEVISLDVTITESCSFALLSDASGNTGMFKTHIAISGQSRQCSQARLAQRTTVRRTLEAACSIASKLAGNCLSPGPQKWLMVLMASIYW